MLAGRGRETARLDDLLGAAREGHGGALVVRGEPGIGKTRLLEYAMAGAADMTVLDARGVESDAELPFAGLFDLLRSLDDTDVSRLTDALASDERGDLLTRLREGRPVSVDRFAVGTVVLRVLCAAAEHRPVLVCVDDLHWLDPASADAITFVARRVHHDPVAVLLAVRDEPDAATGFDELLLHGLDAPAAADLVRTVAELPVSDGEAGRLAAVTGGNPLALTEIARELANGHDRSGPRHATAELFRHRLAGLDDGARAALLTLALDSGGGPALVWRAAAALGIDADAFEHLEAASLVTITEGRLRLAHPLIRSAALDAAAPRQVRAAHRAWAAALTGSPALRSVRAWHLAAAAVGPDAEAAVALDEAGTAAGAVSAYATASVALERAAQLTEDDPTRSDRLLRAGVAARLAGRPAQGARLLDEAAACAVDPPSSALVDCERGRRHLYHGRISEARRLFTRGADRLRTTDPERAAELLGMAAWTAMISFRPEESIELARRGRALVGGAPSPATVLVDLTLGTALFGVGAVAESYRELLAAGARVEEDVDGIDPDYVCFAGVALSWVGEFRRARSLITRVIERARPAAAFGVLCPALHASAYVDVRTGHLVSAYAAATEALEHSETTGNDLWRYFSLGALAQIEAAQGREIDCRRHADEAVELARTMDLGYPPPVRESLGLLELALGHPDEAIRQLDPVNRHPATGELTLGRPTGADAVEAYIRAGRRLPDAVLGQLRTYAEDRRFPGLAALCWRCLGLLADEDAYDACFAEAVTLHDLSGNPFALARTWLLHGERLRRDGRRADARGRLTAALSTFEKLGARQWASRAEAELQAAGAGPRPASAGAGVETLTPQELQVALAASQDRSNRQIAAELFLSPKTVEFHLGNVYRKLGIRSRAGLAGRLPAPVPA